MVALPNIERSAFKRRTYVGYARGAVYTIMHGGFGWGACLQVEAHGKPAPPYMSARTLRDLSDKLARA